MDSVMSWPRHPSHFFRDDKSGFSEWWGRRENHIAFQIWSTLALLLIFRLSRNEAIDLFRDFARWRNARWQAIVSSWFWGCRQKSFCWFSKACREPVECVLNPVVQNFFSANLPVDVATYVQFLALYIEFLTSYEPRTVHIRWKADLISLCQKDIRRKCAFVEWWAKHAVKRASYSSKGQSLMHVCTSENVARERVRRAQLLT